MKFILHGETFDDIERARKRYCDLFWLDGSNNCTKCGLYIDNNGENDRCVVFCSRHAKKAAGIMGIKIIEDEKDGKMQTLPNDISEMTARDMKIHCLEWRVTHDCAKEVCELYKRHMCGEVPHKWETKRCALTPQEIALCKALGAKYVSMDKNYHGGVVELWELKPTADDYGDYGYTSNGLEIDSLIASVSSKVFMSIKPGDCICVEEATQTTN